MRISAIAFTHVLAAVTIDAFLPGTHISTNNVQSKVPNSRSRATTSHNSAYIDINEGAQRDIGQFDQWAANCGVQRCEGFQLNSQDGLDWFAMTNADIPAGSAVLAVPANMILTTSACREELTAIDPSVADAADRLVKMGGGEYVPKFYLFLKILFEYSKGMESPYYPWLNSVPRLYYNAVSMTDFCFECLPPLVFRLARDERVKFENMFGLLKWVKTLLSQEIKEDRELCKWAFSTVQTRRLPGPDHEAEQRIIPMADMFNHGTETEVELNIDQEGNCVAFTNRDVPAGYPLRMSYGCPTNPSFFFARYGFLDETASATFCKILDITKTPELENLGLDFSKMLFYKETGDISVEVWDVVLYAKVLPKYNAALQKQFYDAHMTGDVDTKRAIFGQYMLETCTELKNHVDMTIKQLNDLSAKADGKDLGTHPRLPLILQHNAFVKSTFERVREKLEPMIAQLAEQRVAA